VLSQVGLIFLMFLIGLDFDFGHLRAHGRSAVLISVAGILLPFSLGLVVAPVLYPHVETGANKLGFVLFVAAGLSITAIPVLGRILIEFNLNRTHLGSLTITAAAIDDVCGWIILAVITAIVRSEFSPLRTLRMVSEAAVYGLFMIMIARPLLKKWTRRVMLKGEGEISLSALTVLLLLVFLSAAVTNLIGIFSIFGGFIMGAILYDQQECREAVFRRLKDFTTVFFLPIFFTYTGLRTDIGSMQGRRLWLLCGLVLFAAIMGKFGGSTTAARLNGFSWRESCSVGIMMNTRALMELIVINIGYDLGIIPKSVFFMLVLMAVVTTFMTAPILRRLIRTTELEPVFELSPFMRQRRRRSKRSSDPKSQLEIANGVRG